MAIIGFWFELLNLPRQPSVEIFEPIVQAKTKIKREIKIIISNIRLHLEKLYSCGPPDTRMQRTGAAARRGNKTSWRRTMGQRINKHY